MFSSAGSSAHPCNNATLPNSAMNKKKLVFMLINKLFYATKLQIKNGRRKKVGRKKNEGLV
jgi:hypothetical protein